MSLSAIIWDQGQKKMWHLLIYFYTDRVNFSDFEVCQEMLDSFAVYHETPPEDSLKI